MKSLEEKERKLLEKEREAQVFHQQLDQKEREEAEKEQEIRRYCHQLQEKDREHQVVLQEKDRELHESQDHWSINKDEVTLTKEELGRGSYAVVTVGIFRGLRVAVKSLHNIIISDYNLGIFSREMSIALRVRHPNLVQFIGATKVGNPLILTELMSTNLYKKLQETELANEQILSIAQDVALGLNYLHLFKPQPIIHRDVSSPNVLLKPCSGAAGYEAKVADYGTAKLQQGTSTGTVMPGNPAYAAPEARDPDQHSPAMDVYSYSVPLMEMNLRCPPEMTTADRARQCGRVSWSDMKSLIQRGLNAKRNDRPTMAQVVESLKRMKI
ncbi:PREDICTED: serine/threonine-protein kinase CTR1-like [Amphimedon queenslandica]|nr:PREDICTED: serine/threonine-protein kinase CTR1-like [Amphimedon queenslandica]|eukprot:XP_011405529.1 PREDICTED: serine/threonine-protein kinase CTR1-like [Amphimedon queenslandica]